MTPTVPLEIDVNSVAELRSSGEQFLLLDVREPDEFAIAKIEGAVKALTGMGYRATDVTSKAIVDGLGSVEALTGGAVVRQVTNKGASTLWSMNQKVAKQVLRTLTS